MKTKRWAFGAAAVVALAPVLACSGLGVCWLQFAVARSHDCCDQAATGSIESGPSCAALAVRVDGTVVTPPAVHVFHLPLPMSELPALDAAAPASLPSRPPPLVLRI